MVSRREQTVVVLFVTACLTVSQSSSEAQDNYDQYLTQLETVSGLIKNEALASWYLENIADDIAKLYSVSMYSSWDYLNNLTDHNQQKSGEVSVRVTKKWREFALTAKRFDYKAFKNVTLQRILRPLSDLGSGVLDDEELNKMENLSSTMSRVYSSSLVTVGGMQNLSLNPNLTAIMAKVGNYTELRDAWTAWHDTVGREERELYIPFVQLLNKTATLNGYGSVKDKWLANYEMENISDVIDAVWDEVEPLYKKLHAFVRMKLKAMYKEELPTDGTIPAHLLGNMWAQSWDNLYANLSSGSPLDVSEELVKQNWTVHKMWEAAEDFFVSMGLPNMTDTFWNKSVMTKPTERDIMCHATAWDFFSHNDFRIKMCTQLNMEDLGTIHHEMGHIIYYMLYEHQYPTFREGANEGFHEAVGDLIGLSSTTPSHLRRLGLLKNDTKINNIDGLLMKALEKVAFLPFGFLLDKWRWSIFTGETPFDQMNKKYWELRIQYQGVSPPVNRSEEDLDGAAKYHVPSNTPYLRYFVAYILQFQFHEYLCNLTCAGTPLHECSLYGQKDAGDILRKGLSLGASQPWPETLKIMAGTSKMSGSSIKRYFAPLEAWLDKQIENETVGWDCATVDDYWKEVSLDKSNESTTPASEE
uniref:Angiotensin-converting enzyme n=1 Tax=Ixodes ricinus TaxID=34613 RepID=A0A0K8R3C7_IXORI